MIELARQIAASNDDCYTYQTSMSLTSASVFIDECTFQMRAYMRFLNISIPLGAIIEHAHLEVCSYGTNGGRSEMAVYGIKEPSTNTFSTQPDADARPMTAAFADWICGAEAGAFEQYWAADSWHGWPDGPELKNIIQEIVNQPGWASGNPLAMKIVSTPVGGAGRLVWSYDGNPSLSPILHVTYIPAPGAPSKVTGLNATNIAETSFKASWNANPPEEETTLYRVYLRKV